MIREFIIVYKMQAPHGPPTTEVCYLADEMALSDFGDLILKRDDGNGTLVDSLVMKADCWITCLERQRIKPPPPAHPTTQGPGV
jgi:hypothetical protein